MKNRLLIFIIAMGLLLLSGCSRGTDTVNTDNAPTAEITETAVTAAPTETPTPEPTATPVPEAEPAPIEEPEPTEEPTPEPEPEPVTPLTIWGGRVKNSSFDDDLYEINDFGLPQDGYANYKMFGDRIICQIDDYEIGQAGIFSIDPVDFSVKKLETREGTSLPFLLKINDGLFALNYYDSVFYVYNTELESVGEFVLDDLPDGSIPDVSPDGRLFVYLNDENELACYDYESGETTYPGVTGFYDCFINQVLSGDRVIITEFFSDAYDESIMHIYDLHTGEEVRFYDHVLNLTFEPDGTRVLNVDYDEQLIQLCDAETMEVLVEFDPGNQSECLFAYPLWEKGLVISSYIEYGDTKNFYFINARSMETGELVASTAFSTNGFYNVSALIDEERGVLYCMAESGSHRSENYIWDFLNDDSDIKGLYTKFTELPEILYTKAHKLEEKFGIYVYIGPEASVNRINDYRAEICMNPDLIEKSLVAISNVFSMYPSDFFEQLKEGPIHTLGVYVTGPFTSVGENTVSTAIALANTCSYECCLLIDASYADSVWDPLEETLIHEISHWIDRKIDNETEAGRMEDFSGRWLETAPSDFDYLYSYTSSRYKNKYISGWADNDDMIYYLDDYSQTYPTEDRARLMEHIMSDDLMENSFQGVHLREKLHLYFGAIREAFDTSNWPEETLWEQKLREADERAEYINEHPEERYGLPDEDGIAG